jgi:hypothetical protein
MVLGVRAQVLGELVDPLREERDLDFRRAGVVPGSAMLADDLALRFLCESQFSAS